VSLCEARQAQALKPSISLGFHSIRFSAGFVSGDQQSFIGLVMDDKVSITFYTDHMLRQSL
jgi:hypothetical protein